MPAPLVAGLVLNLSASSPPMGRLGCRILVDGEAVVTRPGVGMTSCVGMYRRK
ncbi:hypothetical protein [Actinomadura darangshiensis]|uniref:hypothetical protein n=1 Tax=Actinomadura darangshiensis TaxID=705336 RepID=UPI0014084C84|nr:hypothetical protein [Actinomadura darangshiensis]